MSEEGAQQLYWDEDAQRYYKYDADKNDYYTDDETRAADEATAQEAAAEAAAQAAAAAEGDDAPGNPASAAPSRLPSRALSPAVSVPCQQNTVTKAVPSAPSSRPSSTPSTPPLRASSAVGSPPPRDSAEGVESSLVVKASTDNGADGEKDQASSSGDSAKAETSQPSPAGAAQSNETVAGKPLSREPSSAAVPTAHPSPSVSGGSESASNGPTDSGLATTKTSVFRSGTLGSRDKGLEELSVAGGRGSGVSAAADTVATAHDQDLKKELLSLQKKLELAEKRIQDLTVQLVHAEQGMTDDERIVNLTRDRDELSFQLKQQEEEIAELEEGLEAAAVEKEGALLQAEKNKELAADIKLQYENLLVDKDLELAALREEMAQQQLQLRDSKRQQLDNQQLRERVFHYDKTFVQLKQLLLDVSMQKSAKEEEVNALLEFQREAGERIEELENGAADDAQLLQICEEQQAKQMELIDIQQQQLQSLVVHLQETNGQRMTYQQAFDRLSRVFKDKEAKNRAAIDALQSENETLRIKTEHLQALTAPRWQRVYSLKQRQRGERKRSQGVEAGEAGEDKEQFEKEEEAEGDVGGVVTVAEEAQEDELESLQIRVASLSLQNSQKVVWLGCRDEKLRLLRMALPEEYAKQIERTTEGVLALHASAFHCFLYLNHINTVYIQPLFADAAANPRTAIKEQGFIRWLVSSVVSVSRLARALTLLLYHLRTSSASASSASLMEQLVSPEGAACSVVFSALRQTTKLLASASACTLSSSFSLDGVEETTQSLSAFLPPQCASLLFENEMSSAALRDVSDQAPSRETSSTFSSSAARAPLLSLLPLVATILHSSRALALLGVAAACVVEVDTLQDGGRGVSAANMNAAVDARRKWGELLVVVSSAIAALPPPLPAVQEGVQGAALSTSASEGERNGDALSIRPAHKCRQTHAEFEETKGFGAWLLTSVRLRDVAREGQTEKREGKEGEGEGEKGEEKEGEMRKGGGGGGALVLEDVYQALGRVVSLLADAPELREARFLPDKSYETLMAFAARFDPTENTMPTLATDMPGRRVWDLPSESMQTRLAESEQLEKKLKDAEEEGEKLRSELEEHERTVVEKTEAAAKWERLYSSARPKADSYDQVEAQLQRVLQEKSTYLHMLDATRRKVELTSTEAHQLRHDKRELSVHVQDLTRRLEALKKISISATSGGDVEQIQIMRNIIRKQELELMDVRLAAACKQVAKQEQDILDALREPGRPELARQASGFSRVSSLTQDLRRDFDSLASTPAVHASKLGVALPNSVQRLFNDETLKTQMEEAEQDALDIGPEAGVQLLDEYRRLQTAILLHAFQVPVWNPSAPPEENRTKLKRYRNEHDALQLQMLSLARRVDRLFSRVGGGLNGGFGEHADLSSSRYIRRFTALANAVSPASCVAPEMFPRLSSHAHSAATRSTAKKEKGEKVGGKETNENRASDASAGERTLEAIRAVSSLALTKAPVMRLTLPGGPLWQSAGVSRSTLRATTGEDSAQVESEDEQKKDARVAEAKRKSHSNLVQKLVVTEEQLASLYKKIAGF
ncbi:UNVERIFIED_CONTAM: hypothetical protein HHA_267660 [Hammondia hammondi]|eukprot:XP_008887689.1 hypothetical protein HHA_267660 [Hammondia hammondi]